MDPFWNEAVKAIDSLAMQLGEFSIAVPAELLSEVKGAVPYGSEAAAILLHKGRMNLLPLVQLREIAHWTPVLANNVFVLLSAVGTGKGPDIPAAAQIDAAHLRPVMDYLKDVTTKRFAGKQRVLLHIPKTAGTSLFEAARQKAARALYLPEHSLLDGATTHFPGHDLIGGHVAYHAIAPRLGNVPYMAVVRDPLDRLISVAGHARRPEENVEQLGPNMRFLRAHSLRSFMEEGDGYAELFLQQWMLTGTHRPTVAVIEQQLDRIIVGTVERLDLFLSRSGKHLGVVAEDVKRLNVTSNRNGLVPQDEIDDLIAKFGNQIEEAREPNRIVAAQEEAFATRS